MASTRNSPRPPVDSQSTTTGLAGARGEESLTVTRSRSAARVRSSRTAPCVCTSALVTSSDTTSSTVSASATTPHERSVRALNRRACITASGSRHTTHPARTGLTRIPS